MNYYFLCMCNNKIGYDVFILLLLVVVNRWWEISLKKNVISVVSWYL